MSMVFGQKLKCFLRQITTKSISQGEQIGISFSFIAPSNFEQKDHKIKAPDYSPQFRPETEIFHCGRDTMQNHISRGADWVNISL